jgi:hypothetical protein
LYSEEHSKWRSAVLICVWQGLDGQSEFVVWGKLQACSMLPHRRWQDGKMDMGLYGLSTAGMKDPCLHCLYTLGNLLFPQ